MFNYNNRQLREFALNFKPAIKSTGKPTSTSTTRRIIIIGEFDSAPSSIKL